MNIPMQRYVIKDKDTLSRQNDNVGSIVFGSQSGYNIFKINISRGRKQKQHDQIISLFQDFIIALNQNNLKVEKTSGRELK